MTGFLSDKELDGLLATVQPAEMPAGLADRIVKRVVALPQRKGAGDVLRQLAVDILYDIFGHPGDVPLHNVKWRIAGAFAALLLGFSAGYYSGWSAPQDEEDTAYYAIYEPEESEVI